MAGFLGMTVQVTLKQSNAILHGKVRDVVAGQTLTLDDAFVPATGAPLGLWTVQGTAIADLQVIDSTPTPTSAVRTTAPTTFPTPSLRPPRAAQPAAPVPPPPKQPPPPPVVQRQASNFVDPAILSYGKSPAPVKSTQPAPVEAPATPVKSSLSKAAESYLPTDRPSSPSLVPSPQHVRPVQQPDALGIHDGAQEGGEEAAAQAETGSKGARKTRRGQKKKVSGPQSSDPPPVLNIEVSRNGNDMNGSVKRGKGWRQTPLLQPSPQAASPAGHKQTRRQREQAQEMQQNGWATEDATDVQDMADFDFEASNKLFDKKGVFDELRQGDTTADEDRLVSHNKLPPRPGTHGGKNLHPTENVLSPKLSAMRYGSHEASSSSDADTEQNLNLQANGRSSSRHSVTRSVLGKRAPSRQNSNQADGNKSHPLAASMSSDRGGIARSVNSLASGRSKPVASIATTSPLPDRTRSPQSAVSFNKAAPSATAQEPHFVIQHTLAPCPVLHPNALHTLEAETTARYGLTQEAITETAARAIAETALSLFSPPPGSNSRRGSRATTTTFRGSMTSSSTTFDRSNTPHQQQQQQQIPVIVILAGNHVLGARAVAAARHLIARGSKVIVAEALYDARESQDEALRAQTAMLKRLQRAGAMIKRGAWRKASGYIKGLTGPPAVIVDALLGGRRYEALLPLVGGGSTAENARQQLLETREMIDWANRSRAPVLSLACPSGVCGLEGTATVVEGEPLAVRPERVLCLGAPMQGLLAAMAGEGMGMGRERWEGRVGGYWG
ncbi:hypothetical protein B0A55_10951 [Friedmanniomyces simplex]|uniref:Enhancer of mRNA-decapping protein 3 n=1 Tax=Friedmanniomyces simplex TaxID=329884 RepID=A0A4U0WNW5_9PEZI|nr:hypothetical protein B0A55_10951 [Friedmanniomyces simplex]